MRIAVDVMGGDHGPAVLVEGALMALEANSDLAEVCLVGNEPEIRGVLARHSQLAARVQVVHASQVMTMEDSPVAGLRKKPDSSILKAVALLKAGQADALVSPGNTGSVVAAALMQLGFVSGVERAAIAALMPSAKGRFVLIDAGANVDSKPQHLLDFAIMGSLYARVIFQTAEPRVGILSVGTEDSKGNHATRAAFKLCKSAALNFIGNVESADVIAGKVEVVVCDGFVGNVFLKTCESMARFVLGAFRQEAPETCAKLAARTNPDNFGGAPLLGVNGLVMIAHGSSKETAMMNAIRSAAETIRHNLLESIRAGVHHAARVAATAEA